MYEIDEPEDKIPSHTILSKMCGKGRYEKCFEEESRRRGRWVSIDVRTDFMLE